MKLKTIKRTKTTSIVLASDEYWGILPDKILHFYCKGQLEYFELSDEDADKLLKEINKHSLLAKTIDVVLVLFIVFNFIF